MIRPQHTGVLPLKHVGPVSIASHQHHAFFKNVTPWKNDMTVIFTLHMVSVWTGITWVPKDSLASHDFKIGLTSEPRDYFVAHRQCTPFYKMFVGFFCMPKMHAAVWTMELGRRIKKFKRSAIMIQCTRWILCGLYWPVYRLVMIQNTLWFLETNQTTRYC